MECGMESVLLIKKLTDLLFIDFSLLYIDIIEYNKFFIRDHGECFYFKMSFDL